MLVVLLDLGPPQYIVNPMPYRLMERRKEENILFDALITLLIMVISHQQASKEGTILIFKVIKAKTKGNFNF